MLRIVLILCTSFFFALFPTHTHANSERMRIFDEEIKKHVEQLGESGPTQDLLQKLQDSVERFNARNNEAAPKEVAVVEGAWFEVQIKEEVTVRKSTGAALGLCGGEFPSCEEAARYVRGITEQCSSLFLATVNVDKTPEVLHRSYIIEDGGLVLLESNKARGDVEWLNPVGVMGRLSADTVAMVMCPEESRTFGHIFRRIAP